MLRTWWIYLFVKMDIDLMRASTNSTKVCGSRFWWRENKTVSGYLEYQFVFPVRDLSSKWLIGTWDENSKVVSKKGAFYRMVNFAKYTVYSDFKKGQKV